MFAKHRRASKKAKGIPKAPIIAAYSGVFLFVITLVATGYRAPQPSADVASAAPIATISPSTPPASNVPSADQLVATNLAAGLAETTNLSVAGNVSSMSVSLATQSELAQSDNSTTTISKPQILQADSSSRSITTYAAVAGDTVPSVAAKYNISPQTLKWANNLTSDALEVGRQLTIPPVDGVIYTVQAGDTVQSIAAKYQANAERITSFNDLELSGVTAGQRLIIPDGQLPGNEQPGYVAPRVATSYSGGYSSGYGAYFQAGSVGNRYAPGNCTWYAYERRAELGRPIGSFWGNASTWAFAAASNGYRVDHVPEVGAIAQWDAYQGNSGYAGHVGVVESVNGDGTITISEMNNYSYGGFNIINRRTLSASDVSHYIH